MRERHLGHVNRNTIAAIGQGWKWDSKPNRCYERASLLDRPGKRIEIRDDRINNQEDLNFRHLNVFNKRPSRIEDTEPEQ